MRNRTSNTMRKGGFTLLETLVALVILATGVVAILLVFPLALDRQRMNTLRTMTTTVSQTQLNRVKAGDTDYGFHQWLESNRLQLVDTSLPESWHVKSWVVSSHPMGEINQGLYRVTLGLRLWDNRVEYYTTYVTDR